MELLTFVWSQSAVDTWNTHLCLSLSHTHTHTHQRTGSTPRQPGMCLADGPTPALVSCACVCAQDSREWIVIEPKSLSHNIISLHLWGVDLSWMADYSQPGLLSSPCEAWNTYGCPSACLSASVCARVWWKHLTPVIIAFRVATGGISIHSAWDLFSGRGCRENVCEDLTAPVWAPIKKEEHIHLYIQLRILSVQMSFSDELWGLTQQPWRRDGFFSFFFFFFFSFFLQSSFSSWVIPLKNHSCRGNSALIFLARVNKFTFTLKTFSRRFCPERLTKSTGSHVMRGRGEVWTNESWVFLRKMASDSAVLTLVGSSFHHWEAKTENSRDFA